jgi:hypothetical protein
MSPIPMNLEAVTNLNTDHGLEEEKIGKFSPRKKMKTLDDRTPTDSYGMESPNTRYLR